AELGRGVQCRGPVRWLEVLRHRPRRRCRGNPRVLADQVHAHPEPVSLIGPAAPGTVLSLAGRGAHVTQYEPPAARTSRSTNHPRRARHAVRTTRGAHVTRAGPGASIRPAHAQPSPRAPPLTL